MLGLLFDRQHLWQQLFIDFLIHSNPNVGVLHIYLHFCVPFHTGFANISLGLFQPVLGRDNSKCHLYFTDGKPEAT